MVFLQPGYSKSDAFRKLQNLVNLVWVRLIGLPSGTLTVQYGGEKDSRDIDTFALWNSLSITLNSEKHIEKFLKRQKHWFL